jgi:hypothetical protein
MTWDALHEGGPAADLVARLTARQAAVAAARRDERIVAVGIS